MVSLLLVATAADKPIDFRPDIGTAPSVVAQLAKQSGLRLSTNAKVANDVVAVVATNKTPREIMDRIAYAINAEWKEEGGEWTLFRSDATIRDQAQKEREETVKQIEAAIEKIAEPAAFSAASVADQVDRFTRQPPTNDTGGAFVKVRDTMPDYRLLIQFLKRTPPEVFAVPLGSRVVLSTAPNRVQQAMPNSLAGLLPQYLIDNEALSTAWIDTKSPNFNPFSRPNINTISKVNVIIERTTLSGLSIRMVAYNPAGNDAFSVYKTIQNDFPEVSAPERLVSDDELIELKPLSKDLLKIAVPSFADVASNPSPNLKAHIEHPASRDPLALLNTESFQAIAAAAAMPLVAAVPEGLLYSLVSASSDGKVTLGRFRKALATAGTVGETRDGWLCYRESNPALGRSRRVDRKAWDAYYRRVERDGRAGLDAFADFILRHPGPLEHTLFPLHQVTFGVPRSNYHFGDDLNVVRLYGSLDSTQKQTLKAQKYIPLSGFSANQAGLLANIYYGPGNQRYNFSTEPGAQETHPQRAIYTEPTECYPDGIKAPFKVTGVVIEQPSLMRKAVAGGIVPVSVDILAWETFMRDRQDLFGYGSQFGQQLDGPYIDGQIRNWEFTFRLSPTLAFEHTLNDNYYTSTVEKRYEQLPAAFRDAIKAKVEEMRTQYRDVRPGQTVRRGTTPPPF